VKPPGASRRAVFVLECLDATLPALYHSTIRVNDNTAQLDAAMHALAHPTRRAILQRLMREEARVTDLAAPFDLSLNAVSKHIRVLETARLVKRRRVWREHVVSFNPQPLDTVAAWIDQQRTVWTQRLDNLDEFLKKEAADQARQEKHP